VGHDAEAVSPGDARFYQICGQPVAVRLKILVAETDIVKYDAVTIRVKLRIAADKLLDRIVANAHDLTS
jgi:hypothetical protein